jgi:hypothetical protein
MFQRATYLFCHCCPAAYLALGFYVFYIIYLRSTRLLTVYISDPCRTRHQDFKQNGTQMVECKFCNLSTVNLGTFVFRQLVHSVEFGDS